MKKVGQMSSNYMSLDKFLLAVESRDLSQADKSIISVSSYQYQLPGVGLISKYKSLADGAKIYTFWK